jgi:hypothetical protein
MTTDSDTAIRDPYKTAAEARLRQELADTEPIDIDRHHRAYQERREAAIAQVQLHEELVALGGNPSPLPDSVIKLAATESKNESVQQILAKRERTRREALEEATRRPRGRNDGSDVRTFEGDLTGQRMELDRVLGNQSQLARHRQMGEAGYRHKDAAEQFRADIAAREASHVDRAS